MRLKPGWSGAPLPSPFAREAAEGKWCLPAPEICRARPLSCLCRMQSAAPHAVSSAVGGGRLCSPTSPYMVCLRSQCNCSVQLSCGGSAHALSPLPAVTRAAHPPDICRHLLTGHGQMPGYFVGKPHSISRNKAAHPPCLNCRPSTPVECAAKSAAIAAKAPRKINRRLLGRAQP